ncbi:hypothetical protein PS726_04358 [Pseudomonas fluorescens]|nr:hypothetical protein PS726_04358 [Pseudomonas fluorescens]
MAITRITARRYLSKSDKASVHAWPSLRELQIP